MTEEKQITDNPMGGNAGNVFARGVFYQFANSPIYYYLCQQIL